MVTQNTLNIHKPIVNQLKKIIIDTRNALVIMHSDQWNARWAKNNDRLSVLDFLSSFVRRIIFECFPEWCFL